MEKQSPALIGRKSAGSSRQLKSPALKKAPLLKPALSPTSLPSAAPTTPRSGGGYYLAVLSQLSKKGPLKSPRAANKPSSRQSSRMGSSRQGQLTPRDSRRGSAMASRRLPLTTAARKGNFFLKKAAKYDSLATSKHLDTSTVPSTRPSVQKSPSALSTFRLKMLKQMPPSPRVDTTNLSIESSNKPLFTSHGSSLVGGAIRNFKKGKLRVSKNSVRRSSVVKFEDMPASDEKLRGNPNLTTEVVLTSTSGGKPGSLVYSETFKASQDSKLIREAEEARAAKDFDEDGPAYQYSTAPKSQEKTSLSTQQCPAARSMLRRQRSTTRYTKIENARKLDDEEPSHYEDEDTDEEFPIGPAYFSHRPHQDKKEHRATVAQPIYIPAKTSLNPSSMMMNTTALSSSRSKLLFGDTQLFTKKSAQLKQYSEDSSMKSGGSDEFSNDEEYHPPSLAEKRQLGSTVEMCKSPNADSLDRFKSLDELNENISSPESSGCSGRKKVDPGAAGLQTNKTKAPDLLPSSSSSKNKETFAVGYTDRFKKTLDLQPFVTSQTSQASESEEKSESGVREELPQSSTSILSTSRIFNHRKGSSKQSKLKNSRGEACPHEEAKRNHWDLAKTIKQSLPLGEAKTKKGQSRQTSRSPQGGTTESDSCVLFDPTSTRVNKNTRLTFAKYFEDSLTPGSMGGASEASSQRTSRPNSLTSEEHLKLEKHYIQRVRREEEQIVNEILAEVMQSPEYLALSEEKERGQLLNSKIVEIKTRYRQIIVDRLFL